jgi:hypothetical protein
LAVCATAAAAAVTIDAVLAIRCRTAAIAPRCRTFYAVAAISAA